MATIDPKKNKSGELIGYRFRACVGRDTRGKQIWRTTSIVAADYTRSMFSEIFKPEKELSYKGLEFYNYPDSEGYADMYFKELDNSVFTSEQKNMPAKIDVKELKKALREKKESGGKEYAESGSAAE